MKHKNVNFGKILAVVVTYEPDCALIGNLLALREQIIDVIVIDNGSANIEAVEVSTVRSGCKLIKNGSNLGIGHALNQGAAIALSEGFSWLATFDQDSHVTEGMISGLLALLQEHPRRNEIGILAPYHRDRVTGGNYDNLGDVIADRDDWMLMRTTITSGNLVSVAALREVGPFDSKLFIDCVDHDFNLRCRRKGFLIVGAKRLILLHSLGRITLHRMFGKQIICSNHSALRRYYMTRNHLEVYIRYLTFEPKWCVKGICTLLVRSVLVLIFEMDRVNKLRAMLKGTFHFATRRFGRLDGFP